MIIAFFSCNPPSPFQQLLETQGRQYHLLIRNGQVLDGQDSIPRLADMLIRNDSILFIGEVDTSSIVVEQAIDATGKYVTPGFIDTHAHGNPLETPGFENFLAMGVTTIKVKARATFSEPHQLAEGMEWVIVHGKAAFQNGQLRGRQGRVLRKMKNAKR